MGKTDQLREVDRLIGFCHTIDVLDDVYFARCVSGLLSVGIPAIDIASDLKVSIPTIGRWATGASCPHVLGRAMARESFIELLEKHKVTVSRST